MWIADVFGRDRAESIDLDAISGLFHRSREMDTLERPDNHVILGAKGSGKSMALKALTFRAWKRRSPEAKMPFAGIYVPMSFDEVSLFRTAFEERQLSDVFQHFFVSTALFQLALQFETLLPSETLVMLFSPFFHAELPLMQRNLSWFRQAFLDDRHAALSATRADPSAPLTKLSLKTKPLTIHALQHLAERFAATAQNVSGMPAQLGLLLDSFDYYGQLGSIFSPLLQSDSSTPLTSKLAARTLNVRDVLSSNSTRMLEPDRDFSVVSLDREPENPEHPKLVRDAISRRVRVFGPEVARELSDDKIIHLLFQGSQNDPDDITSFDSFCRLSSGNILTVILLLERAAALQRRSAAIRPVDLEPLQRECRLKAINEMSQEFWDFEIGVRLPTQKLEAATFCKVSLATGKQKCPEGNKAYRFRLKNISPDKSLISNMLATRVLTAGDDSVNRHVQSGFDVPAILEFELNRMLLPQQGLFPRIGELIELDRQNFVAMYHKTLKAARPHLSPRASRPQRELFRGDFTVFISLPFDATKRSRTAVLRKAINRIYKERTGREGGAGISYVDVHFIPHVGPFRTEIPSYIRDATYVVADISDMGVAADQTPGVFYETGVAIGERKPLALFYNSRVHSGKPIQPFSTSSLPSVLRSESVLTWDNQSAGFLQEFRRIHEKLIAYNGYFEYSEETSASGGSAAAKPKPYAYLSFQPRNFLARQWFEKLINKMYPDLTITTARDWSPDDSFQLFKTIGNASLCIIDCSGKINSQALELGLAAGTGMKRVIEVWNADGETGVNPVAMFPGQKWAWSRLDAQDEEHAARVLNDVGRSTLLGGRHL
jgi:hypothetical protein